MTILHGDARFYNNIFVQQEIRQDLEDFVGREKADGVTKYQFVCGMVPYDDYPTWAEYIEKFTPESACDLEKRDIYYEHLPIYTGGNIYFNGAKPCNKEVAYWRDQEHKINLELVEEDGAYRLHTNLYEYLPNLETRCINTEILGEAFEPEQKFENPDGTAILFNQDYFGAIHEMAPKPGPFAQNYKEQILWK